MEIKDEDYFNKDYIITDKTSEHDKNNMGEGLTNAMIFLLISRSSLYSLTK